MRGARRVWHSRCTLLAWVVNGQGGKQVMAMARFSVMYFGHFILFSVFLLLYALLLVGLITRLVKRTVTESRASQYGEPLG
jgi:membrane protein implicated in regulation of membrane protease activity